MRQLSHCLPPNHPDWLYWQRYYLDHPDVTLTAVTACNLDPTLLLLSLLLWHFPARRDGITLI